MYIYVYIYIYTRASPAKKRPTDKPIRRARSRLGLTPQPFYIAEGRSLAPQPGRVRTRATSARFVLSGCGAAFSTMLASFARVSEEPLTGRSRVLRTNPGCTRPVPPAGVLVQKEALGTVTAKPASGRLLAGPASYIYTYIYVYIYMCVCVCVNK